MQLSEDEQKRVISYIRDRYTSTTLSERRVRFETVDRALQMESKARRKEVEFLDDIELPTSKSPVSTVSNFLIDVFTKDPAIFEAIEPSTDLAQYARQLTAINEDNAHRYQWVRELILYFKSLPKFNVSGIEAIWDSQKVNVIGTDVESTTPDNRTGAAVSQEVKSGNKLRACNMYNTFWDETVDVNKVHMEGEFVGEIERLSMVRMAQLIDQLKERSGDVHNEEAVFATHAADAAEYYIPQINDNVKSGGATSVLDQFFSFADGNFDTPEKFKNAGKHYELIRVHMRIIPAMFGMEVPDKHSVQIWTFYIINWAHVLYVEKNNNAHGLFPLILSQIDEQGIEQQVKSMAESLTPVTNLINKIYDLRIQGLTRAVDDRLLFDKNRIEKEDIDSRSPSARIPVKTNLTNSKISDAIYQIPYADNMGATFLQEIGFLQNVANKVSGLNDPQQGNLQRGNRTLGEFNEVMKNADDDLRVWAILVEVQAMTPLKHIIRNNIFQYGMNELIVSPVTGEQVKVDVVQLRKHMLTFKMADGLRDRDNLLDAPTARTAMELMLQVPQIQAVYGEGMIEIIELLFNGLNVNLTDIRKRNMAKQQQLAENGGKPPTEGDNNAT